MMNAISIVNQYGQKIRELSGAVDVELNTGPNETAIDIPMDADTEWFDGVAIGPRTTTTPTISAAVIVADGVDTCHVDLQEGAVVSMNGMYQVVGPNGLDVTAETPRRIHIVSVGQYIFDDIHILAKSMDTAKLEAWQAVKASHDLKLNEGVMTPMGRVDCDEAAQVNVTKALALANAMVEFQIGDGSIAWTMFDNSEVVHSVAELKQMGLIIGGNSQFLRAQKAKLRAEINETTTLAGLAAINTEM
jgi:hypothetical protein